MAEQNTTRLHIDPPMDRWRITPRNGRLKPVVATGHQPTLWHPGILAKDLAADALAQHIDAEALHVVVEHNALKPLAIDVPTQHGPRLAAQRIVFDNRPAAATLPPNRLSPIPSSRIRDRIDELSRQAVPAWALKRLDRLADHYARLDDAPHLAAQTSAVLDALKRPCLTKPMTTLATSRVVTPAFVDRLLADPLGCVRRYNRAAKAYPEAGIRPLYVGRDAIEAPLWAQGNANPVPVYIDLGDSRRPLLFAQDPSLDLTAPNAIDCLRPRAVTLSAIMRSERCDLFIHGTGGGVYDQVTERWWRDWTGQDLAPMAVVSADVHLPFDAPIATRRDLAQAQWLAHHLPHNVDRFSQARDAQEAELREEKRALLDRMNEDRDKRRRAKAFARLHAINAELCRRHRALIASAKDRHEAMQLGSQNRTIAHRRDWSFALYPAGRLDALATRIRQSLGSLP